jgi:truncated hemoglobin YjbI
MPVHKNTKHPLLLAAALLAVVAFGTLAYFASRPTPAVASHGEGDSVAARLGGVDGIRAFLEQKAVPAVLADPELGPFFAHLTETPGDIEDCLARLLDHDLGGVSAKNGTQTATGHICRSSMSDVHHDLGISDHAFSRFIEVVGREAAAAGVAQADIAEIAHKLESYRGSITRK